ncbi:MAG: Crp/Fnr family transcriptional regulator [Bacteroidota bacterium]|nr:Crp/Fnr family transcriptional regulator [Bacteroidota bacterium]
MSDRSKFWYLKNFNMFEGMDESMVSTVSDMSSMNTVKPNQPIYLPDQPTRDLFFLKNGHVKISRTTQDGNEVILDIIGPGELFGELWRDDEDATPPNETAVALDDVIICSVRKEEFEMLLQKNPALNFQLTKRIGLRLRKFEERVTELVFKDVKKRLATFLVRYASDFGKMKNGVITIKMHLSHQEIALLIGSARQTVTTTLNEFRTLGLIDFSQKGIVVNNLERLKKISA